LILTPKTGPKMRPGHRTRQHGQREGGALGRSPRRSDEQNIGDRRFLDAAHE
jgi:hypothetical protein